MRLTIVGGDSSAAKAFRRRAARTAGHAITVLTRRVGSVPMPGETIVIVRDYFLPPPETLSGSDAVINFAGITSGTAEELQSVNADGVRSLAGAAKREGVRRFIHLSSLSVYGAATDMTLETPTKPSSDYGRSKLAGDNNIAALTDETFKPIALRVPILYGPTAGQKLRELASLMARFGALPVPYLLQPRSMLHVDNLALALDHLLKSPAEAGLRFAADPEPFTLDMLADLVAVRRGKRVNLIRLPDLAFAPLRFSAPGLYNSLYTRSLIWNQICVSLDTQELTPIRIALRDVLPT